MVTSPQMEMLDTMGYLSAITSKKENTHIVNRHVANKPEDIERLRKLRIQSSLTKYKSAHFSLADVPLTKYNLWWQTDAVQAEYGVELCQVFRLVSAATPSSSTLESDFGIASTILTPRRSSMNRVLFDMQLLMKVSKDLLPKRSQFPNVPELSIKQVKEKLAARFTGANFLRTSVLSGASIKEKRKVSEINYQVLEKDCPDTDGYNSSDDEDSFSEVGECAVEISELEDFFEEGVEQHNYAPYGDDYDQD